MSGPDRKVAVITGGSQGIGARLVTAYRGQGWAVVANARTIKPAEDPGVLTVEGDITEPATAERIIGGAVERFGRVDTLINNAGVYVSKPFTDYTAADYALVVGVNLTGFFLLTQRAIAETATESRAGPGFPVEQPDCALHDGEGLGRRDRAMDSDRRIRAAIEEHWQASESGDIETEHAIYATDAILDYPQSGERFRGRATISAQRGGHPASRHFTIQRINGHGDLWVSECIITYDGVPTHSVSIMEFADEHVAHETQYFADPFASPAWRASLADPMPGRSINRA